MAITVRNLLILVLAGSEPIPDRFNLAKNLSIHFVTGLHSNNYHGAEILVGQRFNCSWCAVCTHFTYCYSATILATRIEQEDQAIPITITTSQNLQSNRCFYIFVPHCPVFISITCLSVCLSVSHHFVIGQYHI